MLQAVNDKVIVELPKQKEKSAGGIIIPEGANLNDKATTVTGKVLAKGRGKFLEGVWVTVDCKPGDTVHFGKYAGYVIKVAGKEFTVLAESEILAVERA